MTEIQSTDRVSSKTAGGSLMRFGLFHLATGIYLPPSCFCTEYPVVHQDLILRRKKRRSQHVAIFQGPACVPMPSIPFVVLPLTSSPSPPLSHFMAQYATSVLPPLPSHKCLPFYFLVNAQQSALFMESWTGTALSGTKDDPSSLQTITDF